MAASYTLPPLTRRYWAEGIFTQVNRQVRWSRPKLRVGAHDCTGKPFEIFREQQRNRESQLPKILEPLKYSRPKTKRERRPSPESTSSAAGHIHPALNILKKLPTTTGMDRKWTL